MTTQCENLANHLRAGGTITPMEALDLFGIFRLAARIKELRSMGMDIVMTMIEVVGARGKAHVAQYKLAVRGES